MPEPATSKPRVLSVVTLGGGCFWCMEAVFLELQGVERVESGYSGGAKPNPTYEEVCSGRTGHAEVIQVTFDPRVISLHDVLGVFFATHDPTTPNRQGGDVGEQYRSVVFYRDEEQKRVVQDLLREIERERVFDAPLVTQVVPFTAFYPAEAYHRNYYKNNPDKAYCRAVISPKLAKFRAAFRDKLKKPA